MPPPVGRIERQRNPPTHPSRGGTPPHLPPLQYCPLRQGGASFRAMERSGGRHVAMIDGGGTPVRWPDLSFGRGALGRVDLRYDIDCVDIVVPGSMTLPEKLYLRCRLIHCWPINGEVALKVPGLQHRVAGERGTGTSAPGMEARFMPVGSGGGSEVASFRRRSRFDRACRSQPPVSNQCLQQRADARS